MKIEVQIFLHLKRISGKQTTVCVSGHFHSPDRPLKGEKIFWPYGDYPFVTPEENSQNCHLIVFDSYWETESPGKISPRISLSEARDDMPHEGEPSFYDNRLSLESALIGAKHLLLSPTIQWDYPSSKQEDLDTKGIPTWISKDMQDGGGQ